MRRGFNLLMAIFILLVLAGVTVLTLKYVSISAKHYADSYIQEQGEIFLQSVIESTLLEIEGTQRDGTCDTLLATTTRQSADGRFDANITIERYYLYKGEDNDGSDLSSCSLVESIETRESHGYIMMDVVITSKRAFSPIRIAYRGLQRP